MAADLKPVAKMSRRALAEELVGYHRAHRAMFERIDDLKSALKDNATQAGDSFQEKFPGIGQVSVSGEKPAELKGDLPVLSAEKFFALTAHRQEQLKAGGLVTIEPQYSGKSYGRVTVKLF